MGSSASGLARMPVLRTPGRRPRPVSRGVVVDGYAQLTAEGFLVSRSGGLPSPTSARTGASTQADVQSPAVIAPTTDELDLRKRPCHGAGAKAGPPSQLSPVPSITRQRSRGQGQPHRRSPCLVSNPSAGRMSGRCATLTGGGPTSRAPGMKLPGRLAAQAAQHRALPRLMAEPRFHAARHRDRIGYTTRLRTTIGRCVLPCPKPKLVISVRPPKPD